MPRDYELVVLGAGPAGEKGAAQAAFFGKRVLIVEPEPHFGGASINTGTVPSKTLRESALYYSGLRQRGLYGIDYSLKSGMTVKDLGHRARTVRQLQRDQIAENLERHRIEVAHGRGTLAGPHEVRIALADGGTRAVTTDVILIATGSSPHRPADVPFGHPRVRDSDSILLLDHVPSSLVVVGGGVIGMEYASIFTALEIPVTLVDGRDRLLPFVDAEIAARLRARLESLGARFRLGTKVDRVETSDDGVTLTLADRETVRADIGLWAAGRQSNTGGLGLEAVGVATGARGLIEVNEHYRTSVAGIYAAGDVIGFPALASTSMEQARVAMVHAFDLKYKERMAAVLPLAVYTVPELAMAGLTEETCREQGIPYLVGRAGYDRNARGQIIGDSEGMVKLVFAPGDRRLLGVHLMGEMASELVHLGASVIARQGAIDEFIDAVYNFPTLSDCYKYAAYDGLIGIRKSQQG